MICVVNPSFSHHDPKSSSVFGWLETTLGRTACWSSLIGGPLDLCLVYVRGVISRLSLALGVIKHGTKWTAQWENMRNK